MTHRSFSQGFTLIELLVTITIAVMLVGGGIASYITFNDRQNLQNGAKSLQTYLRSAQSKARAGERPTGCNTLNGYKISLSAGTPVITLSAVCAGGDVVHSSYTLPVGVISASSHVITYVNLYGGVRGAGVIVLETTNGNYKYTFEVTDGGEITAGVLE